MRTICFILILFLLPIFSTVSAAEKRACGFSAGRSSTSDVCNLVLKPTKMYISGHVIGTGSGPAAAKEQLSSVNRKVSQAAERLKGQLQSREEIRATFVPQPNYSAYTQPGRQYTAYQALEIYFPIESDADAILEELIAAGLNPGAISTNYYNNQQIFPVRYQLDNPLETVQLRVEECGKAAALKYCKAGNAGESCEKSVVEQFRVTSYSLTSQKLLQEHGSYTQLSLYYPGSMQQLMNFELLSNTDVQLTGSVTIEVPACV